MEKEIATKKKEPVRMNISKSENGLTTDISVEEIKNGYLVTTSKFGDVEGKYTSETTKVFSEKNPLEEGEEDETKELAKGMGSMFDSLAKSEGMFNVG
jgi:hypothetical protein